MRRQKNSSDSYISSSEETPDNTPKQVWSIISKKKRLKNESSITLYQETNRNSTNQSQINGTNRSKVTILTTT